MTRNLDNFPFDAVSASLGAAVGAAILMGLVRGITDALSGEGLVAIFYWPLLTLSNTPLVWLFTALLFFPIYCFLRVIKYVNWISLTAAGGIAALVIPLLDQSRALDLRVLLFTFLTGLAGGISAFLVLMWCQKASREDHADPWML